MSGRWCLRITRGLSLLALLLLLVSAGCRRPETPAARVGHVDLPQLVRLHPAWPERDSLTALIASAHESHQHPIPPFPVPPDPSLPPVTVDESAADPEERERMERLIQQRIEQDAAATLKKLEQEVERFQEAEEAAAEREARLEAEASEEQFVQRYRAIALRYSDRIAPLELEAIGLRPRPTDLALLSPEDRAARAQRLAAVETEIASLLQQRNEELQELREQFERELRASRAQRLAAAAARAARFRDDRLAELAATRRRQQAQIQADLERSLRLRIALPEIQPRPGPTAAAARQSAARTSASAAATMDRYHEAARDVEHQLYVQRQKLERLISEATRAAVLQLGRTHGIDVHFTPAAGPDLTAEFAEWLRERWATGA